MSELLIQAENVGKKFCRDLKKSLWYGVKDSVNDLIGRKPYSELRPQEFWANQGISFSLERGQSLGLIGRNGAGKTTLLKTLSGLIKPDVGSITMRGNVGALIALGAGFNPVLTARENIYVNASILGFSKSETERRLDEIIDFSGVEEFIDTPVRSFSSGMQVRLGFAIASCIRPDILLVDEVLAVGDAEFRVKCYKRIGEVLKDGCGVILVSHNLTDISNVCSHSIWLDRGQTKAFGSTKGILKDFVNADRKTSLGGNKDQWNLANEPKDKEGYFSRVLIENPNKKGAITISSGVKIEVEFAIANPDVVPDVALRVTDENGICVFDVGQPLFQKHENSCGKHRCEIQIPPHLLNAGTFSTSFRLGHLQTVLLDEIVDIANFTVGHEDMAGNYYVRDGLVVPKLEWNLLSPKSRVSIPTKAEMTI